MLTSARVVFDCPLDQDTLHALFELRLTRLALAEAQFANISQTVEDLISRRLIEKSEKGAYHLDLHIALSSKLAELKDRIEGGPEVLYADELEFYVNLIS